MILTKATNDTELIKTWLASVPSVLTQNQYSVNIKQFLNFIGCELAEVNVEDMQSFIIMLQLKGYQPSTIKTKLNSVKSLFSFAYNIGYLSVNVGTLIKPPKVVNKLSEKIINHEDIKLLVNEAKTLRDKLIIKTLYSLGLRISELINIQWKDFYESDDFIKLTVIGKGYKERTLLINKSLYQQLLKLKEEGNNYVFHAYRRKQPLTRQCVNILLVKLQKKLNLETSITPHKFRHSHATESLKNGCDLSLLQQSLGHASIRTTEIYLNLRNNEGSSTFIDI